MIALSVKQPWATLIARYGKTIETRTWPTKYRGWILIVASKAPVPGMQVPKDWPLGKAVAVARLVDCRPMVKADEAAAQCPIYPKAQAWILTDVKPIPKPFPVKGCLGLYNVDLPQGVQL